MLGNQIICVKAPKSLCPCTSSCRQLLACGQIGSSVGNQRRAERTSQGAPCAMFAARDDQARIMDSQAVVIGSGIAGLAAAQMLSKHFARVVVLEKDSPKPVWEENAVEITKAKTARRGVQQYSHIHVCISRGLVQLDDIFAGQYMPALQAAGGNIVNLLTQSRNVHPRAGVLKPNPDAKEPLLTAFATRHLLETTARELVAKNDKVEIHYGAVVSGLQFDSVQDAAHGRLTVSGVHLFDGDYIPAALVVDCSGRQSNMTEWLAAAGYAKPRVAYATANGGYASWLTKLSPEVEAALGDVVSVYVTADAPVRSLGLMVKVEDGLWMASIGGYEGLFPPVKDAELHDFAREVVWHPSIAKMLEDSTFLAPATRFNGLSSTWRHYEESTLPEGLVMIGDAICSFSPVYGQGMTVAALEVAELDKLLTEHYESSHSRSVSNTTFQSCLDTRLWLQGLSSEMQSATYPIIRAAWDLAVGSDIKFPTAKCTEQRSAVEQMVDRMMQEYFTTLIILAAEDGQVNEVLTRVLHMHDPPSALLQPAMLGKSLLYTITSPLTARRPKQLYQYTAQDIKNNPEICQSASLQDMLLAESCRAVKVDQPAGESQNGKSSIGRDSAAVPKPETTPAAASAAGTLRR